MIRQRQSNVFCESGYVPKVCRQSMSSLPPLIGQALIFRYNPFLLENKQRILSTCNRFENIPGKRRILYASLVGISGTVVVRSYMVLLPPVYTV